MKRKPAKKKAVSKSARKSEPPETGTAAQVTPANGSLVPALNGGMIRHGSLPGNTPGTGRPPDAIRAQMRELGAAKGIPFLEDVLDGKIAFTLVGTCSHCGKESTPGSSDWLKGLTDQIRASVDQRLKANEQAFKYGLGTKEEITVVSEDVRSRIQAQAQLIASRPSWPRDELLAQLSEVWS